MELVFGAGSWRAFNGIKLSFSSSQTSPPGDENPPSPERRRAGDEVSTVYFFLNLTTLNARQKTNFLLLIHFFQVPEQLAVGVQDDAGFFVEGFVKAFHCPQEAVQISGLAVFVIS